MFQSQSYAQKLVELNQFLKKFAFKIIESQDKNDTKDNTMTNELMSAYTTVYELCNSKPSLQQKMLQQFKSSLAFFIESYIQSCSVNSSRKFILQHSKDVIEWYNTFWSKFMRFLLEIGKKVFIYLDRFYLPGMDSNSLLKVGMKVFEKNVCHERNIEFFLNCYFKELRQTREKKIIESSRLAKFAQSLAIVSSEQLITKLTERYVRQSSQCYQTEFIKNNQLTYSQYINKIYNLYLFEEVLMLKCVSLNFFEKLMLFGEFKRHLVESYTGIFIVHGLRPMFKTKNVDSMKVLYQLYRKFEGLEKIRKAYYDLLIEQGSKLIQTYLKFYDQNQSSQISHKEAQQKLSLIDMFYEFYKSHLSLLTQGFEKDNDLLVTLNNATENLIAKQEKFTTILYEYCFASRSTGMFTKNKQKITLLFEKIPSKDEFISSYETELFKKIKSHQISINEEQQFVNYLNEMCGNQLTLRLLKKINDYKEMSKINQQIALRRNQQVKGFKVNLTVLSLQLWEKMFADQITLNLTLPEILMSKWQQIQIPFIEKETKRKLISLPFESILTLSIRFNTHTIQMKCHLIQAAVFTYIASRSYTSEEEIIMNLRLQKNILQSTMDTLQIVPDILLKTTLGDYIVNWNWVPTLEYKDTQVINLIAKTTETTKLISKNIKQDREILVQAAIVKSMKRSKTSTFQELAISVTQMIKLFKPQPSVTFFSYLSLLKQVSINLQKKASQNQHKMVFLSMQNDEGIKILSY